MVSYVVNHQIETEWISVNKHLIVHVLKLVAARKHGLKGAALDVAKSRSPDAKVILATYIQFNYFFNWLYLSNPLFLLVPSFFLFK